MILPAVIALLVTAAPVDLAVKARAQAELDRVAQRIELLKAQQAAGRPVGAELERLLVRSQELAAQLEQMEHGNVSARPQVGTPGGVDPQELREQADALRDEADRVKSALAAVEQRIEEMRRAKKLQSKLENMSHGSALFDESGAGRLTRSSKSSGNSSAYSGADATAIDGSQTTSPAPAALLPGEMRGLRSLAPRPGDSDQMLQRKREELANVLDALHAKARVLDEEARRIDAIR